MGHGHDRGDLRRHVDDLLARPGVCRRAGRGGRGGRGEGGGGRGGGRGDRRREGGVPEPRGQEEEAVFRAEEEAAASAKNASFDPETRFGWSFFFFGDDDISNSAAIPHSNDVSDSSNNAGPLRHFPSHQLVKPPAPPSGSKGGPLCGV